MRKDIELVFYVKITLHHAGLNRYKKKSLELSAAGSMFPVTEAPTCSLQALSGDRCIREAEWVCIQPDKSHVYDKLCFLHMKRTTRFTDSFCPSSVICK